VTATAERRAIKRSRSIVLTKPMPGPTGNNKDGLDGHRRYETHSRCAVEAVPPTSGRAIVGAKPKRQSPARSSRSTSPTKPTMRSTGNPPESPNGQVRSETQSPSADGASWQLFRLPNHH